MRRGTIVVIVFVIAVAVVIGISQFLQSQPPVEFTVAVNPLAEDWLREAVNAFNDTTPVVNSTQRVQFKVEVVDDLSIWQDSQSVTADNHPAAWIATSTTSVDYANRYAVVSPSVARTPLVWGGYSSRVNVATNDGANPFDWDTVQRVAEAESWASVGGQASWRFVNLAFTRPDMTMSGLGALFTAAGDFGENGDLSANATRDTAFRNWLEPVIASVPNFQTLGTDPAAAMARGPSTAAMALLPESLWLANLSGLTDDEPFIFSYPAYQFVLDFPLAGWSVSSQITEIETLAVQALADWLLSDRQQQQAIRHGLRPAQGEPDSTDAIFSAAEPFGILLEPDYGTPITPPSRSEAAGLVQWFTTTAR